MTWLKALDAVVLATGHEPYRWLCSDANPDAESRAGYRALVLNEGRGAKDETGPSPPVPLADSIRATQLGFHRCWFSSKDSACGCSGLRCHLKGRIVGLADCVACLR